MIKRLYLPTYSYKIFLQVHARPLYKTTIFSTDYQNIIFEPVLTEMGICYTFSGTITDYLTTE